MKRILVKTESGILNRVVVDDFPNYDAALRVAKRLADQWRIKCNYDTFVEDQP